MRKLLIGLACLLAAAAIPFVFVLPAVQSLADEDPRFRGPGEFEVQAPEPGHYWVWHNHNTIHEGTTYSYEESLPPGVTITLVDPATGERQPIVGDTAFSASVGADERRSVGYFEIDKPGVYLLQIEGLPETRFFSFGPAPFHDFLAFALGFFVSFAAAGTLLVLGVILVILGIIDLVRRNRQSAPRPFA